MNMGGVTELVGNRKASSSAWTTATAGPPRVHDPRPRPDRLRTRMLTATKGTAIMHHNFHEYPPPAATSPAGATAVMISSTGQRQRVRAEQPPGARRDVRRPRHAGLRSMSLRKTPATNDMTVNPTTAKQLTNLRPRARMKHISSPPQDDPRTGPGVHRGDELVEATPTSIRRASSS